MVIQSNDFLTFTPLGAGREVGRSCFYVYYQRADVRGAFLMDCGINPSISEGNNQSEIPALPFFDLLASFPLMPQFVLITHFHSDHVCGLPYLIYSLSQKAEAQNLPFNFPIFMTDETRQIAFQTFEEMKNQEKIFVSFPANERREAAKKTLMIMANNVVSIAFNENKILDQFNNLSITSYAAGHVNGACMYHIKIANFSLLYTGDYSMEKDKSLNRAELVPGLKPDVLVTEGTYGTMEHTNREEREQNFIDACVKHLKMGGRVLLPVFAVGRVQELIAILSHYWEVHQEMQKYKIYYISNIGQQYTKDQKFVTFQRDAGILPPRSEPSIVFATPGMLQSGTSRKLLEDMAGSEKNLLLVTGYGAAGSLLDHIKNNYKKAGFRLMKQDKTAIEFKMQFLEMSFSAHSDYPQTRELIETLLPTNLVLIHGSNNALAHLLEKLISDYNEGQLGKIKGLPEKTLAAIKYLKELKIQTPANGETLKFDLTKPLDAQLFSKNMTAEVFEGAGQELQLLNIEQRGLDFKIIDRQQGDAEIIINSGLDYQNISGDQLNKVFKQIFGPDNVRDASSQQSWTIDVFTYLMCFDGFLSCYLNQYMRLIQKQATIQAQIGSQIGVDEGMRENARINEQLMLLSKRQTAVNVEKLDAYKTPLVVKGFVSYGGAQNIVAEMREKAVYLLITDRYQRLLAERLTEVLLQLKEGPLTFPQKFTVQQVASFFQDFEVKIMEGQILVESRYTICNFNDVWYADTDETDDCILLQILEILSYVNAANWA